MGSLVLKKYKIILFHFTKKVGVLSFNSMDRVVNERLCILAYSFKEHELGMGISISKGPKQEEMMFCQRGFVAEKLRGFVEEKVAA